MRLKAARNEAYSKWLASFFDVGPHGEYRPYLQSKQMLWQVIQIMKRDHSENNENDWWEDYQDSLFRVFVSPETFYCDKTNDHKQWYLLSPEDSYLVNKYELESKYGSLSPRDYLGRERFLSADRRLRRARLIPVECCRHWRHETTAGELPTGL